MRCQQMKMRTLSVLGLCLAVTEAILTGAKDNNATAELVLPQESHHRSAVLYPDEAGYDLDPHTHYHYSPHQYPAYPHHHHHAPDTLRALLLPLAGVALLGVAAVFASNPVLLQLGVVSGRRRRELRGVSPDLLALHSLLRQLPREELAQEEHRLLATYLTCSGSVCLERLACEVSSLAQPEHHVMNLIINKIINNEFIPKEMKYNLVEARRTGRTGEEGCRKFYCQELDNKTKTGAKLK